MNFIKRELDDYRVLLRSVPSLSLTLFVVSVIMMNLLANKELLSVKYLALDCGFALSWVSFLCMDMICKRFGAKAAAKISFLALFINLIVTLLLKLLSMTPGMWGAYYASGMTEVNDALNSTFGGTWYVVFGSSVAILCSSVCNSFLNHTIAKRLKSDNFRAFALRSYTSTGIAQFVDNLVFASIVSYNFFGWTLTQVIVCSLVGAIAELLCEVVFSPVGYRVSKGWEKDQVGQQYIDYKERMAAEC